MTEKKGDDTQKKDAGKVGREDRFLLAPEQFRNLFERAVCEPEFRRDLERDPCGVLMREGIANDIPTPVRKTLEDALTLPIGSVARCGICGICGACGLCGEIDAGSASAALWALFTLDLAAPSGREP